MNKSSAICADSLSLARWMLLILLIYRLLALHTGPEEVQSQSKASIQHVSSAGFSQTEGSDGITENQQIPGKEVFTPILVIAVSTPDPSSHLSSWGFTSRNREFVPLVPSDEKGSSFERGALSFLETTGPDSPETETGESSGGLGSTFPEKEGLQDSRSNEPEDLFHPFIVRASKRHKVEVPLIKAIIRAESGYNPRAVSEKGAKGLMQLMPGTAKAMGLEDVFDPEDNIEAGVKYFKKLLSQFAGDVKLALAAYNAGSRKVRQFQGIPPFEATRRYIRKVFEYYRHYKGEADEGNGRA
jgi:hypothetical protein